MQTFQLSQASDGPNRSARIIIPGHGRKERDDAPGIMIELDHQTGNAIVRVYTDIQPTEPTHEVDLPGARLPRRKVLSPEVAIEGNRKHVSRRFHELLDQVRELHRQKKSRYAGHRAKAP